MGRDVDWGTEDEEECRVRSVRVSEGFAKALPPPPSATTPPCSLVSPSGSSVTASSSVLPMLSLTLCWSSERPLVSFDEVPERSIPETLLARFPERFCRLAEKFLWEGGHELNGTEQARQARDRDIHQGRYHATRLMFT